MFSILFPDSFNFAKMQIFQSYYQKPIFFRLSYWKKNHSVFFPRLIFELLNSSLHLNVCGEVFLHNNTPLLSTSVGDICFVFSHPKVKVYRRNSIWNDKSEDKASVLFLLTLIVPLSWQHSLYLCLCRYSVCPLCGIPQIKIFKQRY